MKRGKPEFNASLAISRLAVAIEYLTWAQQASDEAERLQWTCEALKLMGYAREWIDKDMPF